MTIGEFLSIAKQTQPNAARSCDIINYQRCEPTHGHPTPRNTVHDGMPERLLIVEDEDTLCASLQRVFRRDGYEVDGAASAESAFLLLETKTYDLIITDIILPGISGIELLTKYRRKNPGQKVMVITAYGSLNTAVEAIKGGACDFIIKPLMHDEMRRAVRRALDGPSAPCSGAPAL